MYNVEFKAQFGLQKLILHFHERFKEIHGSMNLEILSQGSYFIPYFYTLKTFDSINQRHWRLISEDSIPGFSNSYHEDSSTRNASRECRKELQEFLASLM